MTEAWPSSQSGVNLTNGRPRGPSSVARCRAYTRGDGAGRFGLHRLPHFFGTEVQRRGMSIAVQEELMGHEDVKTTCGYQRVTREASKAVLRSVW